MDMKEKALLAHANWNGKLETIAKSTVNSREDLAIAYTPGVAEPCKEIAADISKAYTYTWKSNTVAVVSDGSAVLGLGNIGPHAAMPVMEGKCVLFKELFVGVSAPNIVTAEMVRSMNKDAILFAMANPVPEIMPDVAKVAGARIVGTGRNDFPNQVNNVIAFPGIFKGALEGRATQITEEMKLAAAEALAALVSDTELNEDFIMPEAFDPRVAEVVSQAVKEHI